MYSKTSFPNQQPDEHVLMFLRRHWIAVFKILLLSSFLLVLPFFTYYGLVSFTFFIENESILGILVLCASAYYLFVIMFTFTNFIDYYLDVWIVTDQRIVNIEQKGLFARVVSEKELEKMQDITADVKGFWHTVLNYGDIHIQTAGGTERFVFKQIPFAGEVSRRISNLVVERRDEREKAREHYSENRDRKLT